jgi:predicted dehydrogenase
MLNQAYRNSALTKCKGLKMNNQRTQTRIDRRGFLHSAAVTTAGLTFSPMVSGQSSADIKPDVINMALLGAGSQGRILVNACLKIPGIRFKAVCDVWTAYNQKRASRMLKAYKHEHNTYVDYQEMLDKETDLDAVIIATPDFWHSSHTVACLQARLHVYCETAMSNTIEGARKMTETAKRTGKLLQIGLQRRSNPRYLHCYEKLVRQYGLLGRIAAVSGQWNRVERGPLGWPQRAALDRSTLKEYGYESMAQFRNWRWYRALGGGPVIDRGSHQIDVFNWFLEANPNSVMATGYTSHLNKKTHQWCDTVMAVYEYEAASGPVGAYYQILSSNRSDGYFEKFLGDRGTLAISEAANRVMTYPEKMNPDNRVWARCVKDGHLIAPEEIMERIDKLTIDQLATLLVVDETPPALKPISLKLPVEMNKPFHQPHLENFFAAIRGKASLNCPADVGYATTVAILKVNDAIEAGRKLEFGPNEFVVHDPHKEMIEHVFVAKLPKSVRNCRYHSKSYGMGRGTGWGYFEISRADLPALLDATDHLPDVSELGQDSGVRFNIEIYLERTGESIAWWKPLTLQKRRYAQKIIGSENVTENFALSMLPAISICVGEIRDDWMGVYFTYHCG